MSCTRSRFQVLCASLLTLLLAACSSVPPAPLPAQAPSPLSPEPVRIKLEDGFFLDYKIARTISKLNGRSCYAFITGTLSNQSQQTLSKKSVLDFIVMNQGKQLFRDLSNPVSDIAPGGWAEFGMVVSPVHVDGCPSYEKINVSLRKVFLK